MVAVTRLHPVRNARIDVPLISGFSRVTPHRDGLPPVSFAGIAANAFIFDPERPLKEPNELLAEMGGRMTDPNTIDWNCPLCYQTMTWTLFAAHVRPCLKRNFHLLPIEHRKFTGATPDER